MEWLIRRFKLPPRRVVVWHSLAAVPTAVILAFGAYLSYYYHQLSSESRVSVDQTYRLLDGIDSMMSSVEAAALSERDFVMSGEPDSLAQFQEAAQSFRRQAVELRPLVRQQPRRSADFDAFDRDIAAQFAQFSEAIEARRTQGEEAARAAIERQRTTASMSALRGHVGVLVASERELLQRRVEAEKLHEKHVVLSGIAVTAASIVARLGIAWWMRRLSGRPPA